MRGGPLSPAVATIRSRKSSRFSALSSPRSCPLSVNKVDKDHQPVGTRLPQENSRVINELPRGLAQESGPPVGLVIGGEDGETGLGETDQRLRELLPGIVLGAQDQHE